uniref:Uncharacterized protein n=1 Tax=Glossina brevipalpis TaxID=37001 RepID=A0A1A9W7D7_9MUSC
MALPSIQQHTSANFINGLHTMVAACSSSTAPSSTGMPGPVFEEPWNKSNFSSVNCDNKSS